jgi:hypothetical protein
MPLMKSDTDQPVDQPRRLPAGRGLTWLIQSLALIRAQAARLLFLAVLLQLILGLTQVPVLGLLVVLALPAFSAGLLEAFRRIETGGVLPASILFVPLTQKPANGRLLLLGVVMFAVAALAAILVMGGSDAQPDAGLLQQIEQGNVDAIAQLDPELMFRMMMSALLAVGVSGTISFLAIPLIWFRGMPMARSLLLGLQGLARNWKPFLVLGLGMAVLLVPLLVFFSLLLGLSQSFSPMSLLFAAMVMLSGLLFQLVVLGTQYLSFKDIYGLPAEPAEPLPTNDENQDGQLLA